MSAAKSANKGKKRAREMPVKVVGAVDMADKESTEAGETPAKRSKRAETRPCPICHESIPIRLLGKHSELEMTRVDEIIHQIGSTEVLADAEPDDGMTSRSRRSAVKARKSLSSRPSTSKFASTSELTLDQIDKTVRTIRNRRKQRHVKLRELTREEDETQWWAGCRRGGSEEGTVCPVCGRVVTGDADVVEAHVDSCLTHASILEAETAHRSTSGEEDDLEVDIDGEGVLESVTAGVSFRGTGFDVRDRRQQDVDDDIDVDGEDDVLFGAAQFTEGDIIPLTNGKLDGDGASEAGDETGPGPVSTSQEGASATALKDLVANGKLVRRKVQNVGDLKQTMDEVMGIGEAEEVERAIEKARRDNDDTALIKALESKVKLVVSTRVSSSTSLLCRICLDPYSEPTVSTGCWHTCCRECWLRCLGATKLCPICKRITAAGELRRVYL